MGTKAHRQCILGLSAEITVFNAPAWGINQFCLTVFSTMGQTMPPIGKNQPFNAKYPAFLARSAHSKSLTLMQ